VFEVLSTSGDTHLGGDDFDKRIVDFLAEVGVPLHWSGFTRAHKNLISQSLHGAHVIQG
jgi:hypothetical protein